MFSCEFCEISKHTFFTKHLWANASWRSANQKHSLVNIFWKKKKRKNFMRESFLVTLQGCSLQFSLKKVSILRVLLETFNKVYKQLLYKLYCVNQTGFEIRKKYWTTIISIMNWRDIITNKFYCKLQCYVSSYV